MRPLFTPGPWERTVCRVEGDGQTICVADLMRRADYEDGCKEAEANARLIAAAPKMHAALAAFEKQWNACGGNSHFGGLFQSVRDAAVEALAEADANHWLHAAKTMHHAASDARPSASGTTAAPLDEGSSHP